MDMTKFEFMESVRQQISDELPNIKACFHRANPHIGQQFDAIIFSALERRLNTISVRSSFVFWAYQYLEADAQRRQLPFTPIPKEDLTKLAFLADAAMALMYIHNQVYDNKFGVCDTRSRSNNLGGGNLLKDTLLDEYLGQLPKPYFLVVRKHLRKAFNEVDFGQLIDKNYGFKELYANQKGEEWVENLKNNELLRVRGRMEEIKKLFPRYENAIDVYFARIYLISSSLFKGLAEILISLTQSEALPGAGRLIAFAELYGLLMQVVNDVADFALDAPTTNKSNFDVLSDLRNQTISLPVIAYVFLNKDKEGLLNNYIKERLQQEYKDSIHFSLAGKHNEVLKEMVISKSLRQSILLGNFLAKLCLELFDNESIDTHQEVKEMVDIANYNRYYCHIFKAKKHYKSKAYRNTGNLYYCEEYLSPDSAVKAVQKAEKAAEMPAD